MSIANPNSTDATMGLSLRTRVETRMEELTAALAAATTESEKSDLTIALGEVEMLMTGDRDRIPAVVGIELNRWLEANKHLAEYHRAVARQTNVSGMHAVDPTEGLAAD